MSDTPRTDAVKYPVKSPTCFDAGGRLFNEKESVDADFARTLEREIHQLETERDEAVALAKDYGKEREFIANALGQPMWSSEPLSTFIARLKQRAEQAENHTNSLLARIFRDGGQKQSTYQTLNDAVEAAGELCADYIVGKEQAESMLALNAQIEEQFVDGSPESMIAEICRLRHEIEQAQVCKMQNNLGGSAMTTPNTKQLAAEMAERCAEAIYKRTYYHYHGESDFQKSWVKAFVKDCAEEIRKELNLEQLLADKVKLDWLQGNTGSFIAEYNKCGNVRQTFKEKQK